MSEYQSNYPVVSDSQGEQTNPTTATVMADTGALGSSVGGGGIYEAFVVASASVLGKFQVERRNAANDATVGDVRPFYCLAASSVGYLFRFEILNGEWIRVMMTANLTGTAEATITVQRVS